MKKITYRHLFTNKDLGWTSGAMLTVPQQGDELLVHFDNCTQLFTVKMNRFVLKDDPQNEEIICFVAEKT
jgi:hypothetical protein